MSAVLWVCGVLLSVTEITLGQSLEFKKVTDAYWAWRMEDAPEFATRMNVNDYNNRTESFDIQVLDDRKAQVDKYLNDLNNISRDSLTSVEKTTFDVLKDTLSTYADGSRWKFYGPMNPVNFLEGLYNDARTYIPSSFTNYQDFNDYIQRISGWAKEADNLILRMNKSIEENTTNHKVSMDGVTSQIENFLGNSETDCILYTPFNETLENTTIAENKKNNLRRDAVRSLKELREAYNRVKDFVEQVFMNHTRKGYGVGSLKDGREYYKACLKWHLSIDMPPEEIHQLGLQEVERISKLMQKILDKRNFTGSIRDFFDKLNNDSSFIPANGDAVIADYEDIIKNRVGPKLKKFFGDIPDRPVKVEPMANDGPGGTYLSGSPDGSRPGVFYVNTFRPDNNPTFAMVSLALHEADPGHHLQDIFAQTTIGLPDLRKVFDDSKYFSPPVHFPFYTAYIEGWALYSESLGESDYLDVYKDDFELMGRYSDEIFRACRLVVDTGIHYFNWTQERAIQYVLKYTTMSRESTTVEINRYITWPGQACAYKVGELKIKELRRHSQAALGNNFDIKEFHSVLLRNGAVPLYVLENLVMEWIAEKQISIKAGFLNRTLGFHELVDEYWSWRMEDAPEFASSILVKDHDSKAEQYSVEVLQRRKDTVDNYLTLLGQIDRNLLNDSDRVSYDVLKDTLMTFSEGFKWKNYGAMNPINFLEGVLSDPNQYAPIEPKVYDDFNNYISRLHGYIGQVDDFIRRMKVAFQENTTNHWVSMSRVSEQFEGFMNKSAEDTQFLAPFIKALSNSTIPAANKSSLTERATVAMKDMQDKYGDLKDFIENDYQPETRKEFGVSSFTNGTEYYKACLKWHLSTDDTPEEIHNLGLSEVKRIHAEMTKVIAGLNFTGTTREFFESLNNDSRFFLNTPQRNSKKDHQIEKVIDYYNEANDRKEEVIKTYTDIIFNRIRPKLPQFFKNIPDMPVVVKEMPTDGPGGSYSFGTPDGSKPGVFYVNVKRPEDNPTYGMVALTLHESDPGHHLQDIYAQSSESMPVFRRVLDYTKYFADPTHFPFYTGYTEGWALYAESLGEKEYLDIYKDEYELMGRYSMEIFRACRLVVDTGLHYFSWTREQAIDYMLNYTSYSRPAMEVEIDRYITWPGQACAYKVGELKIRALRQKAKLELGELFDIRDFHSVLLDNGAVPLHVLEQLVNDWIKNTKQKLDTFEKIAQDFFDWRRSDSPEFGSDTSNKYHDKLDSYTYERLEQQKESVSAFQQRLQAINRDGLSKETKISYDILADIFSTFLAGYEWKDFEAVNPINFLDGWHVDFGSFATYLPFNTQGDFVNYVRRVELLSNQYQEKIDLTRQAIGQKHTNNNASLTRVNKELEEFTQKNVTETELYKPYYDYAEKLFGNGPELSHIQHRLLIGIQKLMGKLNEVSSFLTNEYMPKSRPGLGIGTLPNGKKNYEACLKWHTSLNDSPDTVHEKGKQEVARIERRIRESMANLSYNSSWTIFQLYQHMRTDERFLIATPEATINHFKEIIFERIQPKLPKYFIHLPNKPIVFISVDRTFSRVKPTASDGVGGMYMSGSADGSRPGTFYANVFRKEDNPTYSMITLSLHEAIPGHHLAESYASLSDIPDFRKYMSWVTYNVPYSFPYFNAYVEGWALYAEFLGEEMGIYEDHNELLGRLGEEMLRACRLVVDTGIHYKNWPRDKAIAYLLKYTDLTPQAAAIEIDRYTTWPGQACGYKIGEMKIKELRAKAENQLGAKFDIRDFHYTILKNGPMPLGILETVVDDWIKSRKETDITQVKFSKDCDDVSKASLIKTADVLTYLALAILACMRV